MEDGDDSRRAIRPLEAKSDIEKDADERGQRYGDGLNTQLLSGHFADGLCAFDSVGVILRAKGIESLSDFENAWVNLCLCLLLLSLCSLTWR